MADEIPAVFHNGSNCDYRYIINVLANKFKGQFECLRESTKLFLFQ